MRFLLMGLKKNLYLMQQSISREKIVLKCIANKKNKPITCKISNTWHSTQGSKHWLCPKYRESHNKSESLLLITSIITINFSTDLLCFMSNRIALSEMLESVSNCSWRKHWNWPFSFRNVTASYHGTNETNKTLVYTKYFLAKISYQTQKIFYNRLKRKQKIPYY